MKIKCIQDHWPASEGFLGIGAHGEEYIDGLTKGKVYDAQVLNKLSGGGNLSVSNEIKFLIFNDNDEWRTYQLNLFIPVHNE